MNTRERQTFSEPEMHLLIDILASYKLEFAKRPTKWLEKRIQEIEKGITENNPEKTIAIKYE